jgi:hypothetical protein
MSDITYTNGITPANPQGSKRAIYRVTLPAHPRDWTVDLLRKFVKDADALGIPGGTHVRRDPEQDGMAFQTDNRYYGLCVERVEDLEGPPLAKCSENRAGCNCRGN